MGNKVKMSEFDLWELRVKCVIWVFNESSKNFQSYWFSDKKKDFYQIFIFFFDECEKTELFEMNLDWLKTVRI